MSEVKPVILAILDGFGLSPLTEGNAIHQAKSPFFDWAIGSVPKAALHASGSEVGLDWGEMGNSEVGHLNIGTGRIIMQDLPRINRAIDDGSFFENAVMQEVAARVKKNKATLHIIGIASSGGVHGHVDHMIAMLKFAKEHAITKIALHLISDGRDTPPKQIEKDLPALTKAIAAHGVGVIASLSGRYYAMDRDKRWDRVQKAYLAMVAGEGKTASNIEEAVTGAYAAKETDEFITPTVIVDSKGKPVAPIEERDIIVMTNYRADRARQLAASLTLEEFTEFKRSHGPIDFFVSFTSYGQESTPNIKVAFFAPPLKHQLAESIAGAGFTQFHIAETEKYAHVTYFLNGGEESPFKKEERMLIPSPKVSTYDEKPQMSAKEITDTFLKRLKKNPPIFNVVNFANPDMVGHTGNLKAAVTAIETVDAQLLRIAKAAQEIGATFLITADHGNAEQLIHPETHEIDKEHTTNPVPLFMIPPDIPWTDTPIDEALKLQFAAQPPVGVLADIAPTVLDLLGLEKPSEMTGQSLKGLL